MYCTDTHTVTVTVTDLMILIESIALTAHYTHLDFKVTCILWFPPTLTFFPQCSARIMKLEHFILQPQSGTFRLRLTGSQVVRFARSHSAGYVGHVNSGAILHIFSSF